MGDKFVSLVKGDKRYQNIFKAMELINKDLDIIRSRNNILIKPNLTASNNIYANTDKKTLEAIIDFIRIKNKECRITIAEGSGSAYYEKVLTKDIFQKFGYFELLEKYPNTTIECIEDYKDYFPVEINTISGKEKAMVAQRVKQFDYIISTNIPKTHNYAIATLGIKNMMGMVKQEDKSMIHGLRSPSTPNAKTIFNYIPTSVIAWMRRRFPDFVNIVFKNSVSYLKAMTVIHYNILSICRTMFPDLVILDGFHAMDGNGPVDGYPVELGIAIASADALKADGIAARIMGLNPQDIGYLYYFYKEGFGDYSTNGLVGERIENVLKYKFKLHPTYIIQKQWKKITN